MVNITSRISREKLKRQELEPDNVIVEDSKSPKQISEKEFYAPTIQLLALIYQETLSPRT